MIETVKVFSINFPRNNIHVIRANRSGANFKTLRKDVERHGGHEFDISNHFTKIKFTEKTFCTRTSEYSIVYLYSNEIDDWITYSVSVKELSKLLISGTTIDSDGVMEENLHLLFHTGSSTIVRMDSEEYIKELEKEASKKELVRANDRNVIYEMSIDYSDYDKVAYCGGFKYTPSRNSISREWYGLNSMDTGKKYHLYTDLNSNRIACYASVKKGVDTGATHDKVVTEGVSNAYHINSFHTYNIQNDITTVIDYDSKQFYFEDRR